jgi:uracil-DNA glycosylase
MSRYSLWVSKYENCDRCYFSDVRKKIVNYRGQIPCDVLFMGEAPGESEDVLGRPFVGPAGKLLDQWINAAKAIFDGSTVNLRIGFTNAIGCIPRDLEKFDKISDPPKECVFACKTRVMELIDIAQPKIIVAVGKVAEKWLVDNCLDIDQSIHTMSVTHPAAILRGEVSTKEIRSQQMASKLRTQFLQQFG